MRPRSGNKSTVFGNYEDDITARHELRKLETQQRATLGMVERYDEQPPVEGVHAISRIPDWLVVWQDARMVMRDAEGTYYTAEGVETHGEKWKTASPR